MNYNVSMLLCGVVVGTLGNSVVSPTARWFDTPTVNRVDPTKSVKWSITKPLLQRYTITYEPIE